MKRMHLGLFLTIMVTIAAIGLSAVEVSLSGRIVNSHDLNLGIENARITCSATIVFTATTNQQGYFSIGSIESDNEYLLTVSKAGYETVSEVYPVGSADVNLGNILLTEHYIRPRLVHAQQTSTGHYSIDWSAPFLGDTFLRYGSDSMYGGYCEQIPPVPFIVAIRFTPEELNPYVGMSLTAVKVYVYDIAISYGITVWAGGSQTNQGISVSGHDYAYFTNAGWNQFTLNAPVFITGEEEIRIGLFLGSEDINIATTNEGPLHNWKGNLVFFEGSWTTLYNLFSDTAGNWNIEGVLDLGKANAESPLLISRDSSEAGSNDRSFLGYHVWRFKEGQESNPSLWMQVTNEPIFEQIYPDYDTTPAIGYWTKKWAVKALYTGNNLSVPAFSNVLSGGEYQGLIKGRVTNASTSQPVSGVPILFTPTNQYTYSDNNGDYEYYLAPGTYGIFISLSDYEQFLLQNIVITNGEITTVNIAMLPLTDIDDNASAIVATELKSCYPNPFNLSSNLSYDIKTSALTRIEIHNIKGQLIKSLVNDFKKSGSYTAIWNGTDNNNQPVANGVYFLRMTAGKYAATRKVVFLR